MASSSNPDAYGQSHLAEAQGYAAGVIGANTRRAVPVFMPGAPFTFPFGFFVNGSPGENTTGWITGDAAERAAAVANGRTPILVRGGNPYDPNSSAWPNTGFHELGIGGVEGGSARGLAPAPGSNWSRLAVSPDVVAGLGRAGKTAPGEWRNAEADQVWITLANLRDKAKGIRPRLNAALRWPVDASGYPAVWSPWVANVAMAAWSAGETGMANHVNRYAERLAGVPEQTRFGAFLRAVADDVASGAVAAEVASRGISASSHSNRAHTAMRTAQKWATSERLAAASGAPDAWYDIGLGADRGRVFSLLTQGSQGNDAGAHDPSAPVDYTLGGVTWGAAAVGAAILAAVAYWWRR